MQNTLIEQSYTNEGTPDITEDITDKKLGLLLIKLPIIYTTINSLMAHSTTLNSTLTFSPAVPHL